jgi:hypothetical protein
VLLLCRDLHNLQLTGVLPPILLHTCCRRVVMPLPSIFIAGPAPLSPASLRAAEHMLLSCWLPGTLPAAWGSGAQSFPGLEELWLNGNNLSGVMRG